MALGILEGKKILVTGVLTEASIAFTAANFCTYKPALVTDKIQQCQAGGQICIDFYIIKNKTDHKKKCYLIWRKVSIIGMCKQEMFYK
mgnify:CR=1 FL=1